MPLLASQPHQRHSHNANPPIPCTSTHRSPPQLASPHPPSMPCSAAATARAPSSSRMRPLSASVSSLERWPAARATFLSIWTSWKSAVYRTSCSSTVAVQLQFGGCGRCVQIVS
jgi:hypothetical protein